MKPVVYLLNCEILSLLCSNKSKNYIDCLFHDQFPFINYYGVFYAISSFLLHIIHLNIGHAKYSMAVRLSVKIYSEYFQLTLAI